MTTSDARRLTTSDVMATPRQRCAAEPSAPHVPAWLYALGVGVAAVRRGWAALTGRPMQGPARAYRIESVDIAQHFARKVQEERK